MLQTTINIREQINNAQVYNQDLNAPGDVGQTGSVLGDLLSRFWSTSLAVATIFLFIYLIWAGYNWLTAGGDKQKVEDARNRITNAIIGLAIVASTLALTSLINQFFGTGIQINF